MAVGDAKLHPPCNFSTHVYYEHDSGVCLNFFMVKDFNSVGADFIRCMIVLREIEMAEKKLEVSEKQAVRALKVKIQIEFQQNRGAYIKSVR